MIGEKINNYVVQKLLGEGGMGTVYLAEHPKIGRKAAIKVLRRELCDNQELVVRFTNEARAANAIRHPNIIEILDVGELPTGSHYLMMEYLEGESLRERLARAQRLSVDDAVEIASGAASALAAAHAKQIVHRDLKPDNLFLVPDDEIASGQRVKVLDFGIAKLKPELSGGSVKTHTGSLMGTPVYMSPEQCKGVSSQIDHRSDIYALGIILYEMLTGSPPFISEGFGEVLMKHMTDPPPPPRQIVPEIPEHVEAAVLCALAKKPDERFSSMVDLRTALTKTSFRVPTTFRSPTSTPSPTQNRVATANTFRAPDTHPDARPGSSTLSATTLSRTTGTIQTHERDALGDGDSDGPGRDGRRSARARKVLIIGAAAAVVVATALVAGGGVGVGWAPFAPPTVGEIRSAGAGAPVAAPTSPSPAPSPPPPAPAPAPPPGPAASDPPPPSAAAPPPTTAVADERAAATQVPNPKASKSRRTSARSGMPGPAAPPRASGSKTAPSAAAPEPLETPQIRPEKF